MLDCGAYNNVFKVSSMVGGIALVSALTRCPKFHFLCQLGVG